MTEVKKPIVSVLMPAYNVAAFLKEAVNSVLSQSFKDFELIIVEDGSSDNTRKILDSFKDDRIVRIYNEENMGLIYSLNRGLEAARGKYIARIDSDDIMLPERLAVQVKYLDRHPRIGVVSAQSVCMRNGKKTGVFKNSCLSPELETGLLAKCTISHTCVTFRRSILIETGLKYSEEYKYMEDYGLWSNLLKHTRFAAQNKDFAVYRLRESSVTHTVYKEEQDLLISSRKAVLEVVLKKFGIYLTPREFEVYAYAMAFSAKGKDHILLKNAMKSVMRQIPMPYALGKRLLFIYYLSIWWDMTEGKKWKNCFFINLCSHIWKLCKTAERVYYKKREIPVFKENK